MIPNNLELKHRDYRRETTGWINAVRIRKESELEKKTEPKKNAMSLNCKARLFKLLFEKTMCSFQWLVKESS